MLDRTHLRLIAAIAGTAAFAAACSKKPAVEESSAGTVDTSVLKMASVPKAVGPAVQVTKTDSKSVDRSLRYELTPTNFATFMAAADSIAALESRDATTRTYLSNDLTDAGSTDSDAGLKWLQANDSVSAAVQRAGMSVEDYFVQSLAIADATQFIGDPKAAPPTPALAKNARFLGDKKSELAHLQSLRDDKPGMTVTR
jgi:hypothetical protein